MSPELDEQLCAKYPKIFAQRHLPMTQTAMCWGFDCGDGWYELIDKLCTKIMLICTLAQQPPPQAVQVKEKYGTLRFYVDTLPDSPKGLADVIDDLIECAEDLSGRTCEECGAWGNLNKGPWYVTRCKEHHTPEDLQVMDRWDIYMASFFQAGGEDPNGK